MLIGICRSLLPGCVFCSHVACFALVHVHLCNCVIVHREYIREKEREEYIVSWRKRPMNTAWKMAVLRPIYY